LGALAGAPVPIDAVIGEPHRRQNRASAGFAALQRKLWHSNVNFGGAFLRAGRIPKLRNTTPSVRATIRKTVATIHMKNRAQPKIMIIAIAPIPKMTCVMIPALLSRSD
jgi:hypothetical protein